MKNVHKSEPNIMLGFKNKWEVVFVIVVIVGALWILWSFILNSPAGRAIPPFVLDESRRVENPEGFTETKFGQFIAYEQMKVEREWTIDDPACSAFTLLINADDGWVCFAYSISKSKTELPPQIRSYRETIRLKKPELSDPHVRLD